PRRSCLDRPGSRPRVARHRLESYPASRSCAPRIPTPRPPTPAPQRPPAEPRTSPVSSYAPFLSVDEEDQPIYVHQPPPPGARPLCLQPDGRPVTRERHGENLGRAGYERPGTRGQIA